MKTFIVIVIIVLVMAALGAAYYFFIYDKRKPCSKVSNPGIGVSCKCDQVGDDTSKFYGDNWKARGTVCDGGYIPAGTNLNGVAPDRVLELMGDIASSNSMAMPTNRDGLIVLAKKAVERAAQRQ